MRSPSTALVALVAFIALALTPACDVKVPIVDIGAKFSLADATWFAEEHTLFVFYRVDALQGIGPESRIELSWETDDAVVQPTALEALTPVHIHEAADCGPHTLCGSFSVRIDKPPRNVAMQMRYHKDSALTLPSTIAFSIVDAGAAHLSRSLIVYGVFDGDDAHVQWRARHNFPRVRNEQAQALGLRRHFAIASPGYGTIDRTVLADNVYAYGIVGQCPINLTPLGFADVDTTDRAVFETEALPLAASPFEAVCAQSTVEDATGTFTTAAFAFKNAETAPAIPSLTSPITEDTRLGFLLKFCNHTISQPHLDMQIQRLELEGAPVICVDNFGDDNFADTLAGKLIDAVNTARADGADMVLTIGLHHDDETGAVEAAVENALARVMPSEAVKSSPRLVGAFVFDSFGHDLGRAELVRSVLWCPATGLPSDLDKIQSPVAAACALQQITDLPLGPFRFTTSLPVFPSRAQLLTFLQKYSTAQAGRVLSLSFRAPQRTPLSENIDVGDFGVATFFNNEVLTTATTDVFSFCPAGANDPQAPAVFHVEGDNTVLPLSLLPDFQKANPHTAYALGLLWDFPYLMRVNYETVIGGNASAFGFTLPFGKASPADQFFGSAEWTTGTFPLDQRLLRCTRFCDTPTFDSAGVYNVRAIFDEQFLDTCYRPKFPKVGDGGSPVIRDVVLAVLLTVIAGRAHAEDPKPTDAPAAPNASPSSTPTPAPADDARADAYRTPVDKLAEGMIGSASRAVRFDWRQSPVGFGAEVGELIERNNFGSERFGINARRAFGDVVGELAVSWVRTTSTASSDLLSLTPYRQAARPNRFEADVNVSYAVAEGVVTPLPAILPAAEMVFLGTAGARYLVYPEGFGGIPLDQLALDLGAPQLSAKELNNLEKSRLPGMQIDTARYGVLAGISLDVYFQPGVFVTPRALLNLPVLTVVTGSKLGLWWETSITVGYQL